MGFFVWALAPLLLLCCFLDETQIWLGDLQVVFVVPLCCDLVASVTLLARTAGFAGTMTPCESCLLLPVFIEPCESSNFGMSSKTAIR